MRVEGRLRVAIATIAIAGIGVATYLTIVHYRGQAPVCAAGGHGCATVTTSEYSDVAGLPVPLLGLAGYLTILASAAIPGDLGRVVGLFLALIGFGFSLYLTYLELFVIDAICQWCVASAILMTLLLLATGARAARFAGAPPPGGGGTPAA